MNICVINTGGTISCYQTPLVPMSAEEFAQASERILNPIIKEKYPEISLTYDTELKFPESQNGSLDSTNLQPSDWCLMAQYILKNYSSYDGFVILHGTDSMDFTGSALPFLLNVFDEQGFGKAILSKPVIITGSQVPMFYQDPNTEVLSLNFNTDAFQNFCGAVACAGMGIPEVGVYFDSFLFRGNRVLEINASEFRAFGTSNYPYLAKFGIELTQYPERMLPGPVGKSVSLDDPDAMTLATAQLSAISATIDSFPVMQLNAFPAPYNPGAGTAVLKNIIDACVGTGIKGLVLESYGEGNFPSGNPDHANEGAIYKALADANGKNVIIVDSTQVIAGTVNDSAYASGAWLPAVGALSGADMTPMAALAKTCILSAAASHNGWSLDQVKELIQLDLFGEVMDRSRMDSRGNSKLLPGQSIEALDGSATLINEPTHGPILKDNHGGFLWGPFGSEDAGQPGWLVMQNDGNLVLRSDDNVPLWSTQTGIPSGGSSVLMISGSFAKGNLGLSVWNYSANIQSKSLYSQN